MQNTHADTLPRCPFSPDTVQSNDVRKAKTKGK